jgi:two-component system, chemotaxis family, protein-glutamate methylesterase/glutaminase
MNKIKVLTVDDSALMQRMLKSALAQDPEIEHVGAAFDGNEGRRMIKELNPDVITLDVEMPGMTGMEFLERLMNVRPMPVIMFSSHTAEGAEITLNALELGAVDFLQKPHQGLDKIAGYLQGELLPKIRNAMNCKPRGLRDTLIDLKKSGDQGVEAMKNRANAYASSKGEVDLIAISASTGGVTAIRNILEALPGNLPPIVITQHMPEGYTERFASRLSRDCPMTVVEATDNLELQNGHAYIAPGTHHMRIVKKGAHYRTELSDGPAVSGHRPSCDVMFESVAKVAGGKSVGVILTGMGRDGAQGLLTMRNQGCSTIGQNRTTCVVYGMPKSAFEMGAVEQELPIEGIASALMDILCGASAGQRDGRMKFGS